jgi:hypothetical protein
MKKLLLLFSIIAVAAGLTWIGLLTPNHNLCSDPLTQAANYSACQGVDVKYLLAWALGGLGAFGMLASLSQRGRRD